MSSKSNSAVVPVGAKWAGCSSPNGSSFDEHSALELLATFLLWVTFVFELYLLGT